MDIEHQLTTNLLEELKKSQHLTASAADIRISVTPSIVQDAIEQLQKDGKIKKGGLGRYATFTHYDIGKYRNW